MHGQLGIVAGKAHLGAVARVSHDELKQQKEHAADARDHEIVARYDHAGELQGRQQLRRLHDPRIGTHRMMAILTSRMDRPSVARS